MMAHCSSAIAQIVSVCLFKCGFGHIEKWKMNGVLCVILYVETKSKLFKLLLTFLKHIPHTLFQKEKVK